MKIRGHRECKACGIEWSYYDTGEISCPACGSLHSVGTDDDQTLHTATATPFDLAPVRDSIDDTRIDRLAERASDRAHQFTRGYGFIDAGELHPLDETYLAAMELRYAAGEIQRRMTPTDDEERFFTALLRADDGERPDPQAVPTSLQATRGLAYSNACDTYRSDLRTYLEEHPDAVTDAPLERLSTHIRRIQALDGDVSPQESEALVSATRALGRYLIDGDEGQLAVATERLDSLV